MIVFFQTKNINTMPETLLTHPDIEAQTRNEPFLARGEPAATPAQAYSEAYEQTEDYGAEPRQYGPETLETVNARSRSDLHTLLASLPPGDARDAVINQFPGLAITAKKFSVRKPVPLTSLQPLEQYALLPHLLDRAVHMVGGEERARTILQYPGVTLDQDFGKIRPVSAAWLEHAEVANKLGPQMDIVISTKRGRQIFEDIRDRRADWNDVFYGYLEKSQIAHQKDMVAKLHNAFRMEPAMPTGHSHPAMSYVIPDARFGHLWRGFSQPSIAMGLSVADWAERAEGVSLPPAGEPPDNWEATTLDPAYAKRLNILFTDQRFKPYVDTFISLYAAADEAIDSTEAKKILRDNKEQLNTRQRNRPDAEPVSQLRKMVRQAVENQAKKPEPEPDLESQLTGLVRQAVENRIKKIRWSSVVALPADLKDTFMASLS